MAIGADDNSGGRHARRLWALVARIAAAPYAATDPLGELRAAGTRGAADFGFGAETRVAETAPLTLRTVVTVRAGRAPSCFELR